MSEIVELYKSLGYEVRVEPVRLDKLDDACRRCYEKYVDDVKTVYVKKKVSRAASNFLSHSSD